MELEIEKEGPKSARPAPNQPNRLYQPAVALAFFQSAGKPEDVAAGKVIFAENEGVANVFSEGARMYFLLDGEVTLSVAGKPIGNVVKGEVFGEMASISQLPRTATATAKSACKVISMNEKQFQAGLAKAPEFALMLMAILIGRVRETLATLTGDGKLTGKDAWNKAAVFDRKLLAEIEREFEERPPAVHPINKVIVKEGDKGIFMYVVREGVVAISVAEKVIEKIGPGGVFGEIALVDQSARVATAVAETDCTLLSLNRKDFMELVKSKPTFALSLLKALSERLRFMTSKYK